MAGERDPIDCEIPVVGAGPTGPVAAGLSKRGCETWTAIREGDGIRSVRRPPVQVQAASPG